MKSLLTFFFLFSFLLSASSALAAEVSIGVSSRETYVDVPVTVQITVSNAQRHSSPDFPQIAGALVKSMGPGSTSSQVTIVNGKMTRSESMTYSWQITPQQEGRIEIPSIEVQADGQTHRTQPQIILVSKSETGDLLFVELRADKDKVYVGDSLSVTLEIWLKPYRDQRYQLDERDMFRTIDVHNSAWGPFAPVLERKNGVSVRSDFRKDSQGSDRAYLVYELKQNVWTERAGQYDPGRISIVVKYPTRIGRPRDPLDIFSSNTAGVSASKPISQSAQVAPVDILPIPQEHRPAYYRDAVGQYRMQASAKPIELAVGDPITLTVSITGAGRLDTLQPPPLTDVPELAEGFKLSTDPAAGVVEGSRKTFTQSIRPKSDGVTQIPPIPFAYFDPKLEQFVTVWSDPIPLTVRAAETLAVSQIAEAGGGRAAVTELRELEGGILANYTGMDEVLSRQAFAPSWTSAAALGVPPALFFVCFLSQRHAERLRNDRALARRRSAHRKAQRAIRAIGESSNSAAADRLAAAVTGYVADRLDLPAAGLTRTDVVAHLQEHGAPQETLHRIDELLLTCESAKYAGLGHHAPADLAQRAAQCINDLESEKL